MSNWLPDGVTATPLLGDDPGGWSGLVVDEQGSRFWAVHDDAGYGIGQITRQADGTLAIAELTEVGPLSDHIGTPIVPPNHDSEGLARDADGRFAVSFEWQHRVWFYDDLAGAADRVSPDPRFEPFRGNVGLEAVTFDGSGGLLTFRERQSLFRGPGQSYARPKDGSWRDGPALPVDGYWSAVGAETGADGWLYILERRFRGIGFATRLRRMDLTAAEPAQTVQTLYQSPLGRHGNLEGLSLWTDPKGRLRALMVSDDNRNWFQRSEIVEVILALQGPDA